MLYLFQNSPVLLSRTDGISFQGCEGGWVGESRGIQQCIWYLKERSQLYPCHELSGLWMSAIPKTLLSTEHHTWGWRCKEGDGGPHSLQGELPSPGIIKL